ncbi:MAG: ribosome recycling factor [Rhizobiales bacterium]|nr:ribosome recycling factor [Hyphomicrobiales bacterium]
MSEEPKHDLKDLTRRMEGAVEALKAEFAGLRTGRASSGLLEPVMVDAYGSSMPMSQVGTISVPEPRMLSVQIWDQSLVGAAEKAIRESNLGLNPMVEGQVIRVPIPELSEDRRRDLTKVAHQYAEQAKVAVRNVRRHGMETLKVLEHDFNMSKDEHRDKGEEIQQITDKTIKEIDDLLEHKDAEIMHV